MSRRGSGNLQQYMSPAAMRRAYTSPRELLSEVTGQVRLSRNLERLRRENGLVNMRGGGTTRGSVAGGLTKRLTRSLDSLRRRNGRSLAGRREPKSVMGIMSDMRLSRDLERLRLQSRGISLYSRPPRQPEMEQAPFLPLSCAQVPFSLKPISYAFLMRPLRRGVRWYLFEGPFHMETPAMQARRRHVPYSLEERPYQAHAYRFTPRGRLFTTMPLGASSFMSLDQQQLKEAFSEPVQKTPAMRQEEKEQAARKAALSRLRAQAEKEKLRASQEREEKLQQLAQKLARREASKKATQLPVPQEPRVKDAGESRISSSDTYKHEGSARPSQTEQAQAGASEDSAVASDARQDTAAAVSHNASEAIHVTQAHHKDAPTDISHARQPQPSSSEHKSAATLPAPLSGKPSQDKTVQGASQKDKGSSQATPVPGKPSDDGMHAIGQSASTVSNPPQQRHASSEANHEDMQAASSAQSSNRGQQASPSHVMSSDMVGHDASSETPRQDRAQHAGASVVHVSTFGSATQQAVAAPKNEKNSQASEIQQRSTSLAPMSADVKAHDREQGADMHKDAQAASSFEKMAQGKPTLSSSAAIAATPSESHKASSDFQPQASEEVKTPLSSQSSSLPTEHAVAARKEETSSSDKMSLSSKVKDGQAAHGTTQPKGHMPPKTGTAARPKVRPTIQSRMDEIERLKRINIHPTSPKTQTSQPQVSSKTEDLSPRQTHMSDQQMSSSPKGEEKDRRVRDSQSSTSVTPASSGSNLEEELSRPGEPSSSPEMIRAEGSDIHHNMEKVPLGNPIFGPKATKDKSPLRHMTGKGTLQNTEIVSRDEQRHPSHVPSSPKTTQDVQDKSYSVKEARDGKKGAQAGPSAASTSSGNARSRSDRMRQKRDEASIQASFSGNNPDALFMSFRAFAQLLGAVSLVIVVVLLGLHAVYVAGY